MKIIDCKTKGNEIRIFYTEKSKDGICYKDFAVPYDYGVFTPEAGKFTSNYTIEDIQQQKAPILVILRDADNVPGTTFEKAAVNKNAIVLYYSTDYPRTIFSSFTEIGKGKYKDLFNTELDEILEEIEDGEDIQEN